MDHFGTYALMYLQVIFEGSHPTLKLIKQKMSEIICTSQCSISFLFCQNPKNDQVWAKKPIRVSKNQN